MPKKAKADDTVLVKAAKTIGTAAGKITALAGAGADSSPTTPKPKVSKLQKHTKSRLPRLEKKAQKKAASLTP
jgi:hypothetical protein